jgi:hypothetical protein
MTPWHANPTGNLPFPHRKITRNRLAPERTNPYIGNLRKMRTGLSGSEAKEWEQWSEQVLNIGREYVENRCDGCRFW